MESSVFNQYKPVLKKFSRNQARMLVKLIQRETDQSGYEILKAFLGSFRATFWQGFGRLFGVSLKGSYSPSKDEKDAIIERVCIAVEQGELFRVCVIMAHPGRRLRASVIWTILCQAKRFAITDDTLSIRM